MIKLIENEHVLRVAHKHWFMLFTESFFLLLLLAIPFAILFAYETYDLSRFIIVSDAYQDLFIAFTAAWLLLVWIIFFVIWTDYYLDVIVLTDKRLIDIEQRGLFSRSVATLELDKIQDISVEVSGLMPTFLDFGVLTVQTAAMHKEFVVKGIARPYDIKDKIMREHARYAQKLPYLPSHS